MHTGRIAELLEPFLLTGLSFRAGRVPDPSRGLREGETSPEESAVLSPTQLDHISAYIDLLLRWNARINLTSIREPEEIVTRHFGESLFVARHLFPNPARVGAGVPACPAGQSPAEQHGPDLQTGRNTEKSSRPPQLIDVGAGAGFPGLPIKIWATQVQLTLIESSQKKATFLREVIRALTLTNVDVFAGRAADFPAKGTVVTLRAVERFDSILPTAASVVAADGRLAILVGEAQVSRVRELAAGVEWGEPVSLPLSSNRVLLIGTKEPD